MLLLRPRFSIDIRHDRDGLDRSHGRREAVCHRISEDILTSPLLLRMALLIETEQNEQHALVENMNEMLKLTGLPDLR
jgi:hypothetical protein